jgi:EmrB/QacA subfamily drug resistance transporter
MSSVARRIALPRPASRWLVLGVMCLSVFVVNVSTTIINIALPSLVGDLGASTRDLLWIVDAFNLAFASLVLAGGSLSDRFGRRRTLLLGLAGFAAASLAGAWSDSPTTLIIWRAAAGIAAAAIFPVTLSIISNAFPDRKERAGAIGAWGAATGLAVAAGPIVGGALVQSFWWGSILVANGAVALVALGLAILLVPESRDPATPPLDVRGLVLSILGLGLLVQGIIQAPERGWSSGASLASFAAAALVLVVFVVHESRTEHPMLDVSLFRDLRFSAASAAIAFAFFALFGFVFLITQYFQFVRGYGPLDAGLRNLPVAFAVMVSSLLGTRLAIWAGTKLVVAGGLLSLTLAFLWITQLGLHTSYLAVVGQMVLLGMGLGLTSAPATEAIMGVVPVAKAGIGSAVNDATREIGGTLGVAVIGSVALSIYRDSVDKAAIPVPARGPTQESVGGALEAARRIAETGHAEVAAHVVHVARTSFLDGLSTGCYVAAGVTAVGLVLTLCFLPAQPGAEPATA